jgi:hypothetical protein
MSKEDPMATQAVKEYLHHLEAALRDLPRSRRQELLGEIHEHIDSALAEAPAHDPGDIAEEARQRFGVPKVKSGAPGDRRADPPPHRRHHPPSDWLVHRRDPLVELSGVTTGEKLAGARRDLAVPGGLLLRRDWGWVPSGVRAARA